MNTLVSESEPNVIPLQKVNTAAPDNARTVFDLGGAAFENHHAPVFHAWLNMARDKRRLALHDRYVFFSVATCAGPYLANLVKIDLERANGFVHELCEDIVFLSRSKTNHTEEWYRGLDKLAEALTENNYLPEASELATLGLATGALKYPRIAQSLNVHVAYLDALAGRSEKASEIALRLVRKPYLLPNRRELPRLFQKLMYILSAGNHMAEYKFIMWKGATSTHANAKLRDFFLTQIGKTYRGVWRVMLRGEVPLRYRLGFPIGNLARVAASVPALRKVNAHLPLQWLHLLSLYALNIIPISRKTVLSNSSLLPVQITRPKPWSLPKWPRTRKIVVTRAMGGIGDLMMMTPGLKALAMRYPGAQIDFAIPKSFHPLFEGFDAVRLLDINEDEIALSRYNRWVNLTVCPAGQVESRQYPNVRRNRIEIFAGSMGISLRRLGVAGYLPYYTVTEEEKIWAEGQIRGFNPTGLPVIGLQPYAADTYKNWPYMQELARELGRDHCVLIFHNEDIVGYDGKNIHKVLVPLRKSIALLSQCERLVAVDSSFVHISAALGVKTVAIFGPTSGNVFCRYYDNVRYVVPEKAEFPCNPCWRNEHKPCHLTNGRESICFRSIEVGKVISALNGDPTNWRPKRTFMQRLKSWTLYGRD